MDILSTTLPQDKREMIMEQLTAQEEPPRKRQKLNSFKEAFEIKFIKDPSTSEGLKENKL